MQTQKPRNELDANRADPHCQHDHDMCDLCSGNVNEQFDKYMYIKWSLYGPFYAKGIAD